jgi:hypothetical protein
MAPLRASQLLLKWPWLLVALSLFLGAAAGMRWWGMRESQALPPARQAAKEPAKSPSALRDPGAFNTFEASLTDTPGSAPDSANSSALQSVAVEEVEARLDVYDLTSDQRAALWPFVKNLETARKLALANQASAEVAKIEQQEEQLVKQFTESISVTTEAPHSGATPTR